MSLRSDLLARLLGGALFLMGTCLILPIILFRQVAAVLAVWPTGPLA